MGRVIIVDFGTGNLRSVQQAVLKVNTDCDVAISDSAARITAAERIILPGQGAIGTWMQRLQDEFFARALRQAIRSKPTLAICVGMQAMFARSTENEGTDCMAIVPGLVQRFQPLKHKGQRLKVPQMGWNQIERVQDHELWQNIPDRSWFYFVHSYFAPLGQYTAARCEYGIDFTAVLAKKNIFAVQFHPEKSHYAGLQLYRNFLAWQPQDFLQE